jgi:hypothetical protein
MAFITTRIMMLYWANSPFIPEHILSALNRTCLPTTTLDHDTCLDMLLYNYQSEISHSRISALPRCDVRRPRHLRHYLHHSQASDSWLGDIKPTNEPTLDGTHGDFQSHRCSCICCQINSSYFSSSSAGLTSFRFLKDATLRNRISMAAVTNSYVVWSFALVWHTTSGCSRPLTTCMGKASHVARTIPTEYLRKNLLCQTSCTMMFQDGTPDF